MDREKIRDAVIRYGLLFLVSIILVAGFWFHAEFYQIGLVPLLLIGGFVTFLVVLSVRALMTGSLLRGRARGVFPVPRDAGERILAGTQTIAILPVDATVPPVGSAARAVIAGTGAALARVAIRGVRRRLVADVPDEEATAAGYDGGEDFRRQWAGGRWNPRDLVLLVSLRREGAR